MRAANQSTIEQPLVRGATARAHAGGSNSYRHGNGPRGLFMNPATVESIAGAMRQILTAASGLHISIVTCLPVDDGLIDDDCMVYQTGWTEGPGRPPRGQRVVARYSPDGLAQRTHVVLRGLWRAGFDGRDGFTVPRPFASLPELSFRLESRVIGTCLARSETEDSDSVVAHAEGAGRWLARLHRSDVGGRLFGTRDERLSIQSSISRAISLQPTATSRLRTLEHGLSERLREDPKLGPTHGDFRARHVFVAPRRVTVAGFERFSLSESERDLGRFIADGLVRVGQGRLSITTAAMLNRAILMGYEAEGGSGSLGRVGLWTAIELLHLLADNPPLLGQFLDSWLTICERPIRI